MPRFVLLQANANSYMYEILRVGMRGYECSFEEFVSEVGTVRPIGLPFSFSLPVCADSRLNTRPLAPPRLLAPVQDTP
jgi:hypothetical protein